jgi:hypothetical protein
MGRVLAPSLGVDLMALDVLLFLADERPCLIKLIDICQAIIDAESQGKLHARGPAPWVETEQSRKPERSLTTVGRRTCYPPAPRLETRFTAAASTTCGSKL